MEAIPVIFCLSVLFVTCTKSYVYRFINALNLTFSHDLFLFTPLALHQMSLTEDDLAASVNVWFYTNKLSTYLNLGDFTGSVLKSLGKISVTRC